jgi:hypothetical protein
MGKHFRSIFLSFETPRAYLIHGDHLSNRDGLTIFSIVDAGLFADEPG